MARAFLPVWAVLALLCAGCLSGGPVTSPDASAAAWDGRLFAYYGSTETGRWDEDSPQAPLHELLLLPSLGAPEEPPETCTVEAFNASAQGAQCFVALTPEWLNALARADRGDLEHGCHGDGVPGTVVDDRAPVVPWLIVLRWEGEPWPDRDRVAQAGVGANVTAAFAEPGPGARWDGAVSTCYRYLSGGSRLAPQETLVSWTWTAQNQTLSPPYGRNMVSFSPWGGACVVLEVDARVDEWGYRVRLLHENETLWTHQVNADPNRLEPVVQQTVRHDVLEVRHEETYRLAFDHPTGWPPDAGQAQTTVHVQAVLFLASCDD